MKKVLLMCVCLCAVMAHAQQEHIPQLSKNAMVMRMGAVTVTDPTLLRTRDSQLLEKKTIMADNIKLFEEIVYQKLWDAVGESKRFEITDSLGVIQMNNEMQSDASLKAKKENPHLAEVIAKSDMLVNAIFAVDWRLNCNINQCQLLRKGNYGWICTLHITPIIQDRQTETMRVVDSRPFVNNVKETKVRPTMEAAFSAALDAMHADLVKYFTENFPVYGKVMKLDEKNNAVLNCGAKYNLQKGDLFQVTHMIPQKNSKERLYFVEQVIGTLKVKQVLDESCICDLSSGADKIIEVNGVGGFLQCKQIMK